MTARYRRKTTGHSLDLPLLLCDDKYFGFCCLIKLRSHPISLFVPSSTAANRIRFKHRKKNVGSFRTDALLLRHLQSRIPQRHNQMQWTPGVTEVWIRFTSNKVKAESVWRNAVAAESLHSCTSTIKDSSLSKGSRWTWMACPRSTMSERLSIISSPPLA